MTKCPNCGHINDKDASFCENCGANLKAPAGMSNLTKALIIAVIVLVGILGVVGGMMIMGNQTAPVNNTTIVVNQTVVEPSAEWHLVNSFSGVINDYRTFNIRGNKFKVVMKTTPTYKNTSSYMTTEITDGYSILNSGTLSWSSTARVTTEEKTLEVSAPPGTYAVRIYTKELEGWTITIYDYY